MAVEHHTFPVLEEETMEKVSIDFADLGDGEKLRTVMDEYGMVVVKGVVSSEEAKQLEGSFGRDLASLIDTKALLSSCPSSSNLVERIEKCLSEGNDEELAFAFPGLFPTGTRVGGRSFAITYGLPQGRFAWECRNKYNIRKVFSALHSLQEEDLCVGLDTVFYTNPSLQPAEESNRLWPHADQNLAVPDSGEWPVYQSILYVRGSDEEKGLSTTIVWPKSHKEHFTTLMNDEGIRQRADHYAPFTSMKDREIAATLDSQFLKEGRRIPVPAGGLLVWSSRTIHQGHAGGRRLAMPVCWEPRNRRTEETLRRKLRLLLMGFASTHWAALGNQHPRQPTVHTPLPPSENEADVKAWVEFVEGALASGGGGGGSSFEAYPFASTQLPCFSRIPPACLLPGKEEEYKQVEERAAKDVKAGFAGIDGDRDLCNKISSLFDEKTASVL